MIIYKRGGENTTMKKTTSIFLLICIALSLLASCGKDTGNLPSDETTAAETETETTEETVTEISDNLPEMDYESIDYNVLAAAEQWIEFYESELTGEVIDDAVYKRNLAVEERFDIKLKYNVYNGYYAGLGSVKTALSGSVLSGSGDFDLMVGGISYVTRHIANNLYTDLNKLNYLDFSQPWWYDYVNDELEIFDRLYLAAGQYGMLSTVNAVVTFFNKQMMIDYNLGNMYDIVKSGEWTYDKMIEMASVVIQDVDGNGIYDMNDVFGMVSTYDYISFFPTSMDYRYSYRDDEGNVILKEPDEKILKINEYVYLIYNTQGLYWGEYEYISEMLDMFTNDRALFMPHVLNHSASEVMREMEDFGIIPVCKYDEAQKEYITTVVSDVAGIPFFVKDFDMSALILEALASETYKTVRPAYYDVALTRKYSRDNESNEMLDIIFTNPALDFTYIYIDIMGSDMYYQLGKDLNYASWSAKKMPGYQKSLINL